jgi:Dolichyl-phosphate-mannose-protein mannosyltransferase
MALLLGIVSLISVAISSFLLTRLSRASGLVDHVANFFTFFSGQIIAVGYILSWFRRIHTLEWWVLLTTGFCLPVLSVIFLHRGCRSRCFRRLQFPSLSTAAIAFERLSVLEKRSLLALAATTVLVGILNFVVLVFTAPHNVDSMYYHLTRMAYYLQEGHLGYYDATYWAQVVHPKNSTILQIYTYLVTGRNENLTQLIEFMAYWVAVVVIFGIALRIGLVHSRALFAALVFALLTQCVMQSNTTQNDMLVSLYIALVVYGLLSFHASGKRGYLVLAGIQLAMAIGTKMTTLLALPSVVIIALLVLVPRKLQGIRPAFENSAVFCLAFMLAMCVFALPSSYFENYLEFGHPLGPAKVRDDHNAVEIEDDFALNGGAANLLRLGFGFVSLDGLPPIRPVNLVQRILRTPPAEAMDLMGLDLEKTNSFWRKFYYQRRPVAHEDESFLGIFGFTLLWPLVLLFSWARPESPKGRWLAWGALLFIVMLSYGLAWEPWHGRRAIIFACFAAPLTGWWLHWQEKKWLRYYLAVIVGIGCLSAICAVLFRHNGALIPLLEKSVFQMDRLQQLTRNEPTQYEPIRKFDELTRANATVGIYLRNYYFEYPLFGERLTRKLIQLNSFWRGEKPVPQDADYLLYSQGYFDLKEGDIDLGRMLRGCGMSDCGHWYLRKLERDVATVH